MRRHKTRPDYWEIADEIRDEWYRRTGIAQPASTSPADQKPVPVGSPVGSAQPVAKLGVTPMPSQSPSAEHLHAIANAVADFLDTHAKYKILLDGTRDLVTCAVPRLMVDMSLCRLERLLNPQCQPYSPALAVNLIVSGWPCPPYDVMSALPILRQHVYELIKRWDMPEVCEGRPIVRSYGPGESVPLAP